MAVMVAFIALVVQIYSLAYMSGETPASFGRYYAYHSLFAFAMLGLVLSDNLLLTYVFWELVGLGSYLLIGFWFEKPEAGRAAMKAFWTTRLGDVGFALGIVVLWSAAGTLNIAELFVEGGQRRPGRAPRSRSGVAGIYLGAMGKSAQFPFHIWLPDAMEGPTPVSALIHAATMVAAGVYLMVRIAPLLTHTPQVAAAVFAIGVLTAFIAASMATVENDIKRILAFSTVSQLGFMMAAVGCGGAAAGYFHLLTHAVFKALLFLAAGSLIHARAHQRHLQDGEPAAQDAGHLHRVRRRRAGAVGRVPDRRLLLEGRGPGRPSSLAGHPVGVRRPDRDHGDDRVLHRPRLARRRHGRQNRRPGIPHEPPAAMTVPLVVLAALRRRRRRRARA